MDYASKGAMAAAEQYGVEQDEAEERARIADAHGLNVGEAGYIQLLFESDEFQMLFPEYLIAIDNAMDTGFSDAANGDLASWLINTGRNLVEKEINRIMKANAEAAKRDEGDPA